MVKIRKNLIVSIVVLLLVSLIAVSLTVAWFQDHSLNSGTINKIEVSTGDMLQISTDGGETFSSSFNFSFSGLLLEDITGDGITFIAPEKAVMPNVTEHGINYENIYSAVPSTEEGSQIKTPVSTKTVTDYSEACYISLDLIFRANSQMNIYLTSDSFISPASTTIVKENASSVIGNKSDYGSFSKDAIAGAMRASFVTKDAGGNDQVSLFWIPNSDFELSFGEEEGSEEGNHWYLKKGEDGTPEDDESIDQAQRGYFYYENTVSGLVKHNVSNYVKELPEITRDTTEIPSEATPIVVLSWDEASQTYRGSVTLNIWLEGTDREARRALAGGNINAKVQFLGVSLTPATAEPTATPTAEPTATPTAEPTATPTAEPTATPTAEPTATPTAEPTATPTAEPTATPTAEPTASPTGGN